MIDMTAYLTEESQREQAANAFIVMRELSKYANERVSGKYHITPDMLSVLETAMTDTPQQPPAELDPTPVIPVAEDFRSIAEAMEKVRKEDRGG